MLGLARVKKEDRTMKNQYRYYIVDKYIVRIFAWKVRTGRLACYHETRRELWDRAQKYGYTALALD